MVNKYTSLCRRQWQRFITNSSFSIFWSSLELEVPTWKYKLCNTYVDDILFWNSWNTKSSLKGVGDIIEYYKIIKQLLDKEVDYDEDAKKILLGFIYKVWWVVFEPIYHYGNDKKFSKIKEEVLFRLDDKLKDEIKSHIDFKSWKVNIDEVKGVRNKILDFFRENWESFELFKIILEKVFKNSEDHNAHFTINIETEDILNLNFQEDISSYLNDENNVLKPENITFELLEHTEVFEEDRDLYLKNLKFLNIIWFKISIDDLYTWYSTPKKVNCLLNNGIKVDSVKIDMSIIHEWKSLNDPEITDKKEFLSNLKKQWITIISEWIETDEHLMYAISLWSDHFQWHMFSEKDDK